MSDLCPPSSKDYYLQLKHLLLGNTGSYNDGNVCPILDPCISDEKEDLSNPPYVLKRGGMPLLYKCNTPIPNA